MKDLIGRRPAAMLAAVAVAVTLAACGPAGPGDNQAVAAATTAQNAASAAPDNAAATAPVVAATSEPSYTVEEGGVRLTDATGAVTLLAFDQPKKAVLAALAFRGKPDESTNEECGAGPMAFATLPDGLVLHFQEGRFVGWHLDEGDRSIATTSGIGIGTSRTDLAKKGSLTVEESTLGTEFALGGLNGLLSDKTPSARVTNLWSGTDCAFR